MAESFIYVGQIVNPLGLTELEFVGNGLVVVVNGIISAYESTDANLAALQNQYQIPGNQVYRLARTQFLSPGLIDTHIHGPQYPNAGLGYDLPLLEWLDTYTFPLEKKFADPKFAQSVYEAIVDQTLSNGTTTASYFATIHRNTALLLANGAISKKQRAFVGKVNMNVRSPEGLTETLMETLEETKAFLTSFPKSDLVKPVITPRFAISCDMDAMKGLAELAAEFDVHIQTHVSENQDEVKAVAELFPDCANYADVYDKAGLLTKKTILAHGVLLTDNEVDVLISRGTSLSHCPNSNISLQSGICHVWRLLGKGLKIGLGTDCAGGYSVSMLDSMRQALQSSTALTFSINEAVKLSISQVYFMATLGGAQALAIDDITGNFAIGKQFDAIVVDMQVSSAVDLLDDYDFSQLFQKFVYLGDDRNLVRVYVAGNLSVAKS